MVKLVYSALNQQSVDYVLKELNNRDKSINHVIIVPDRCAFNMENMLFEKINSSCFFDIKVLTLSRLVSNIVEKYDANKNILYKQDGIAIIKKIILESSHKFLGFSNGIDTDGFALLLFQILCLFKSNNILADKIFTDSDNVSLNNKMQDIKFVYNEYEKYLQNEFTDSFNKMNLFCKLLQKDDFCNTSFYFMFFDDFTRQGYNVITKLMQLYDVTIATTYGKDRKNKNIYLNNVYNEIMDIIKQNDFDYKTIDGNNSDDLSNISNNLLAYKPTAISYDKIKIQSFKSREDELRFVLKKIKLDCLNKKCSCNDCAIVVPSINNFYNEFSQILNEFDLPYYIDSSEELSSNSYIRFIKDIMQCITLNFDKTSFLKIIKCPYIKVENIDVYNYEIRVNKFGIYGLDLLNIDANFEYPSLINIFKQFIEFTNTINSDNTVSFFVKQLNLFLENENFYSLEEIGKSLLLNDEILEYKKNIQAKKKLDKIFENIQKVMGDYKCSFKIFCELLVAYFENTTLSYLQVFVDSLLIADSLNSYLSEYKYLYILTCNEGLMPLNITDDALLCDDEIDKLSVKNTLSPTAKFINKKNRFKIFENFFHFKNTLFLSYCLMENDSTLYPSNFIQSFLEILGNNTQINKLSNDDLIIFNNFNKITAKHNLINDLKNNSVNLNTSIIKQALSHEGDEILSNCNYKINYKFDKYIGELFNSMDVISISQLESYFRCPFKFLMEYGFRIKDIDDDEIKALDNGNIIHKYLYEIVPVVYSGKAINICDLSHSSLSKILSNKEYDFITKNKMNKHIINSLYNEAERILKGIIYQKQYSEFIPKFLEYKFICNDLFNYKDKSISLKGVIDRIDIFNNYFRIIDYKSGDNDFSNYNDLFSGKKLQLFLYLKYILKEMPYEFSGACYMSISNKIIETEKSLYNLSGVIKNSRDIFEAFDNRLKKISFNSDIINIKTTQSGEIYKNNTFNFMCLDNANLNTAIDYALHKSNFAIQQIFENKFTSYPIKIDERKNECLYCKFKGICNFDEKYGLHFNELTKTISCVSDLLDNENI